MTRFARLVALVMFLLPVFAQANDDVRPGDTVRIDTEGGAVEGLLVEKVPDGYLVKTGAGNVVVSYTKVRSIRRTSARAGEAPGAITVATPVLYPQTREDLPAIGIWAPMELLGVNIPIGLGDRVRDTPYGRIKADSQFAIGGSIEVPVNRWLALEGDVIADYTWSKRLPDGSQYKTETTMSTLWVRPYLRGGPTRLWAGAGMSYAVIRTRYQPASTGPVDEPWFNSYGGGFAPVVGAGLDAYLVNRIGMVMVIGASVEKGAYETKSVRHLELPSTRDRGPVVHETRFVINIAFGLDVDRLRPLDEPEAR